MRAHPGGALGRPAHPKWGRELFANCQDIGSEVTTLEPGQFAIGLLFVSDNICQMCQPGYHISRVHREFVTGAQAD